MGRCFSWGGEGSAPPPPLDWGVPSPMRKALTTGRRGIDCFGMVAAMLVLGRLAEVGGGKADKFRLGMLRGVFRGRVFKTTSTKKGRGVL